jgi:C1A family cysteine protease
MNILSIICVLLVGLVFAHMDEADLALSFKSWAAQHGKTYGWEEEPIRFENFKASVIRINTMNAYSALRGNGATFGLNKFSDLSREEFAEKVLMTPFRPTAKDNKQQNLLIPRTASVPSTFDWRDHEVVTAVKDQGQCGSCWAFSVTENVESVWMINKKITNATMEPLAPQQIVDCDDSDAGCSGGNPPTAYEYIQSAGGLDDEKDYPYTAQDGTCAFKSDKIVAQISGYQYATDGDEDTMSANLVSWAPLSICVDARYWQDYTGGILTEWQCDWIVELDHCVQAVGFDTSASTPFWIVRNSWGTDWGENGYIRLQYGTNTCGLTEEATSATV